MFFGSQRPPDFSHSAVFSSFNGANSWNFGETIYKENKTMSFWLYSFLFAPVTYPFCFQVVKGLVIGYRTRRDAMPSSCAKPVIVKPVCYAQKLQLERHSLVKKKD